jgi:hypothetical protein
MGANSLSGGEGRASTDGEGERREYIRSGVIEGSGWRSCVGNCGGANGGGSGADCVRERHPEYTLRVASTAE